MARRNFIVIDDIPALGGKVNKYVCDYYNTKGIYEYDIKLFTDETHFLDSKKYIEKHFPLIDVIFSDQNLRGGDGKAIFKIAHGIIQQARPSIACGTQIYKVLHSNEDLRLKEHQTEHLTLYDYFINSESENDMTLFLDFYEKNILLIKENGNVVVNNYLYQNPHLKNMMNRLTVTIDGITVSLRNILMLIMDINDTKKEHYYFYYNDGESIKLSQKSKKPDPEINQALVELSFVAGTLSEMKEKFKVNPLWVSSIDTTNSIMKLFQSFSMKYEIRFDRINANFNLLDPSINRFFL